jgi:hypothetical protein
MTVAPNNHSITCDACGITTSVLMGFAGSPEEARNRLLGDGWSRSSTGDDRCPACGPVG